MNTITLILQSIIAFVTTNIDDLFILILFYSERKYVPAEIYAGHFAGIAVLTGISMLGSFAGRLIDAPVVGLLGLFPIYLGIRRIFSQKSGKDSSAKKPLTPAYGAGVFSIAMVTIANGGDNIGTYIPLFASLPPTSMLVMTAVFFILVFVWVAAAGYLSGHPLVSRALDRCGHSITPAAFILLGLYILHENGAIALLR